MSGTQTGTPGPVSLLFTPNLSKTAEASRTPELRSGMRSPRASASLFGSRGSKWDAFAASPVAPAPSPTPARRRSLTPSGSGLLSRETPPMPPAGSLMDISPPGAEASEAAALATAKVPALQHPPHDMAYKSCWVTVFGLTPESLPDTLREFGQCGEIGAERALLRDGRCVRPGVMVGVRRVPPEQQDELESAAEKEESGGTGGLAVGGPRRASLAAPQGPSRIELAPAPMLVPGPPTSAWAKLGNALWGL
ncbi:hypothetical protein QBZ16_000231 [Prototheca wickerhamii]|uniref:RRM Nup35-type domain-containing protein n=1 Tax=Prototheca wickerhamii TaxID=3111 RepID=A0AAD9IL68_PROWI|nr:hypothetical protein QBZ16_000231 [Prototheca wickerhamii]